MSNMTIANTINDQIGHRARVMMGAKNLMGDDNCLSFKIGRNPNNITHIKVTLDPSDTYTVDFIKIRKVKGTIYRTIVETCSDVYVDSLHNVIESGTGLYLSL